MTSDGAPARAPRRGMDPRLLGYLGAATQLVLAFGLLALVNLVRDTVEPPEPVDRGLALALLYALPAAIGGLGAWAARRSLLAAAAMACAIGSVLSMSGVTLLFLAPALLFAVAAAKPRATWGAPAAAAARSNPAVGLGLAIVLAALMVGSGVSLLALTEARCWVAEQTSAGIVYRIVPDIGGVSVQSKGESAGCSSAVLTPRGAVVAAILGIGALGLAVMAAIPRRRPPLLEIALLQLH
ncbi:MAG TPA: hypothetical protein VEX41_10090 [Candidatus Eisenbacteria bacterium]|nr:hypothetical protein [Candidatus Eisenbacteria bacterium]